jgi:hypothetical protein
MAYYHRDNPEQVTRVATVIQFTEIFVRLAGVLLLLVGLVVGIQVIMEAWDLYRSPEHIERFSWAIEKGTNLDKSIAALTKNPSPSSKTNEPGEQLDQAARSPDTQAFVDESIRLSYLLAWIIAILLLMLIGRLALAAIKTGGELALYDREVKGFARTLLKETSKLQRGSEQQAVPFSTVKKK